MNPWEHLIDPHQISTASDHGQSQEKCICRERPDDGGTPYEMRSGQMSMRRLHAGLASWRELGQCLLLLACLLISGLAAPSDLQNVTTIQPGPSDGMDTCYGTVYVTTGCPTATDLYIGGWGDYYYDFFQFDLTAAPTASTTLKAELWLYGAAPRDPKMQLGRITQPWTKESVTLSNNPSSIL